MAAPVTARADQIGSLLRPPELRELTIQNMLGEANDAELRRAQDEAVVAVLAKQEAIGFPVLTDGEFRRRVFWEGFAKSVAGLDLRREAWRQSFVAEWEHRDEPEFRAPVVPAPVTSRLRVIGNAALEEYRLASQHASGTLKVTLSSPLFLAQSIDLAASRQFYAGAEEITADSVAVNRELIGQLKAAGCPYIQIDAPNYSQFIDPSRREAIQAQGMDIEKALEQAVQAEAAAVAGFDGVTFGLHVCRGNRPGYTPGQGSYAPVAEQLFSQVPHQRLLLEYDTERAGGFEVLRFVPKDKVVVIGVVSTKTAQVETVGEIKCRVEQAAKYLPLEQLAISAQCGFASHVGGPPVPEEAQWQKMENLVEAARQIWGTN